MFFNSLCKCCSINFCTYVHHRYWLTTFVVEFWDVFKRTYWHAHWSVYFSIFIRDTTSLSRCQLSQGPIADQCTEKKTLLNPAWDVCLTLTPPLDSSELCMEEAGRQLGICIHIQDLCKIKLVKIPALTRVLWHEVPPRKNYCHFIAVWRRVSFL